MTSCPVQQELSSVGCRLCTLCIASKDDGGIGVEAEQPVVDRDRQSTHENHVWRTTFCRPQQPVEIGACEIEEDARLPR